MEKFMFKGFQVQLVTLLALILIMPALFLGCFTITANSADQTQEVLFREAGNNLAYYGLEKESDKNIKKIETDVRAAMDLLDSIDTGDMVKLISNYIASHQFDGYAHLVRSATNLLNSLITINLEIPENQKWAAELIKIFLNGSLDGITDLQKDRRG